MHDGESSIPEGIIVYNRFIRGRNVLLSEVDCGGLFVDYYLHRKDHRLEYPSELDALFKDLLAAFTLHGAAHPRNRVMAWTIRYPDPLASVFLVGDTEFGTVAGRVFTENVREGRPGDFYQDLKLPGKPLHRSMVDFDGRQAVDAVERFYAQSEQRPGRFFPLKGDRYALLTAHPDYDEAWFSALDRATVERLEEDEELSLIETRNFGWFCGCSHEKILQILVPTMREDPEGLFQGEESVEVTCPRCGARYRVTREALEDQVARSGEIEDNG